MITGLVGAAGARGFVLPNALGSLRQLTQSYGGGFLAFALVGASGAVALFFVGRTWEGTFLGKRWGRGGPVVRMTLPGQPEASPGARFHANVRCDETRWIVAGRWKYSTPGALTCERQLFWDDFELAARRGSTPGDRPRRISQAASSTIEGASVVDRRSKEFEPCRQAKWRRQYVA